MMAMTFLCLIASLSDSIAAGGERHAG